MLRYLDDLLVAAGEGLIVYGVYLVDPVAAVFAAGLFLIVDGVVLGMTLTSEPKSTSDGDEERVR